MLGSNNKIIPEYYHEYMDLKNGATLKIFDADGVLKEAYKYNLETYKWIK